MCEHFKVHPKQTTKINVNFETFFVHPCMSQYVREVVMRVLMFYNSRNIKV